MAVKVYVRVNAEFSPDGEVRPRSIIWSDGNIFEITAIKLKTKAASTKVGGCGMRYTVMVEGHERYLFRDEDRWFVESTR